MLAQKANAGGHLYSTSKYAHFSQITEHNKQLFPLFEKATPIRIVARPGDCITIPAGWWHWVRSVGRRCVSVNFWSDTTQFDNQQPTLIEHAIDDWPAIRLWTNDYLIKKIDDGIPDGLWLFLDNFAVAKSVSMAEFVNDYGDRKGADRKYAYLITPLDYEPWKEKRNAKILDLLASDFKCPLADKMPNAKANFWMNFGGIDTGLHFDDEPGVLCVVDGVKDVLLYPPSDTQFLYPYPSSPIHLEPYDVCAFHYNLYKDDASRFGSVAITGMLERALWKAPNVARIAKAFQDKFGVGKLIYGIKNRQGVVSFEFYFYGINRNHRNISSSLFYEDEDCNPEFFIDLYMDVHNTLFPGDAKSPYDLTNFDFGGLCIFSIDLDEENAISGTTGKLNLYYTQDEIVNLPFILTEWTYFKDGTKIKRCKVWTETMENMMKNLPAFYDRCLKIGILEDEIKHIVKFIHGSPYKCPIASIFNKGDEIGLYFYGIDYSAFKQFVIDYDYPVHLIEYVIENEHQLKGQQLEVGFHFSKSAKDIASRSVPCRTAFYGIF